MAKPGPAIHTNYQCIPFAERLPQISSVFSSLSGETEKPLPPRFAELKRTIIGEESNQRRLIAGWERLTKRLRDAAEEIERQQQDVSNAA